VKKRIGFNRDTRDLVYISIRYIHQINNEVRKKTLLAGITSNHHSESAIKIIPSLKKNICL